MLAPLAKVSELIEHAPASTKGSGDEQTIPENKESTPEAFECNLYVRYPKIEWAERPIRELLLTAEVEERHARLGEPLEGCVKSLSRRFEKDGGFLYGFGVNPHNVDQKLSIVIISRDYPDPSIYLAPAAETVERLINTYHLIHGPTAFPRRKAGSGDYAVVDVPGAGTAILVRKQSGEESESRPYQLLYPSVAAAWIRIMELTHRWQWPSEVSDEHGEQVFQFTTPGGAESDARVTFNVKERTATWWSPEGPYPFTATQPHAIELPELEADVRQYLR